MKRLLVFLLLSSPFHPYSQVLKIGDTFPDTRFDHVLNYNTNTLSTASLEGKSLLIDFYATWCTSCLHKFSILDSIQRESNNRLQILLVNSVASTGDTDKKISDLIKKKKNDFPNFSLPSVIDNDSVLLQYFPHRSIPHYVWVDANRKIIGITASDEVNRENIKAFISGKHLVLHEKKDILDWNSSKPLFSSEQFLTDDIKFKSVFTGIIEGIGGGFHQGEEGDSHWFTCRNTPILNIYYHACQLPLNRFILEVKDSSRYLCKGDFDKWHDNLYTYELSYPASTADSELNAIIVQDINRYCHLNGRVEKRLVNCWVLIDKEKNRPKRIQKGRGKIQGYTKEHPLICMDSFALSAFILDLNFTLIDQPRRPIILNESGYDGPVSMELTASPDDLPSLQKELQKYGFDLLPAQRELQVFVITEM